MYLIKVAFFYFWDIIEPLFKRGRIIMKNLKYSIRAIILAGTISLTGCGQATPIIEAETEREITIEATIENQ